MAVIGGGLTGCEIAYELALQGKKVSVIEMKNDLIAAEMESFGLFATAKALGKKAACILLLA